MLYLSGVFVTEKPKQEIDSTVEENPPEMVTAQSTPPEIIPPVPDHISGPVELKEFAFEVSKVHEVVKGDTLWDICEYYTGNPLNYHIVAVHNEIPNPDFILPGQKIVLYQKDKEQDKKRSLP